MKNLISLVLIIFISVLSFSCEKNTKEPGYQINILTDMVEPVPYEYYGENSTFKNGITAQTPPEGTIYRGGLVKDAQQNPVEYTKQVLQRGQFVYKNYCLVCHGTTGEGDGPLIPKFPNPPDFKSNRLLKLTDREIFDVISKGKGDMPSHAGQIEPIDRWKLIYYVRELQGLKNE